MKAQDVIKKNTEEKIWHSIILDVDNVGVVIKQKGDKWFLCISGTKELVVDITDLFKHSTTSLTQAILEDLEGMKVEKDTDIYIMSEDEQEKIIDNEAVQIKNNALSQVQEYLKKLI